WVARAEGRAWGSTTDGKGRANGLGDGRLRWKYDSKTPLVAPPALAAGVAYAGDLRGVVHAIDLGNGTARWTFDVGAAVKAPGMIYGGPVVHGGRLLVATCNPEGPHAGGPHAGPLLSHPETP